MVGVAYVSVMHAQSAQDALRARPLFVAFFIGLTAATAWLASRPAHTRLRPALLGLSATGLLGLGTLAIFSIGVALLLLGGVLAAAATLATLAARPGVRGAGQVLAGVGLALALLAGGAEWKPPSTGSPARRLATWAVAARGSSVGPTTTSA